MSNHLSRLAAVLFSAAVLTHVQAQTTTLGTRSATNSNNPAVLTNAAAKWTAYSRPEVHAGAITKPLQYVTLSSGKKLAVYVSVPANWLGMPVPGKFPVILTQTAYRADAARLLGSMVPSDTTLIIGGLDKFMVKRGYITVAFDVYGTGLSDGRTKLLGEEVQQAYAEAVNWITRQAWFDGNLGVAGTSYLGISALLTAEQRNPAVKAVFAELPMGDPYRGTVVTGGLFNAWFLKNWLVLTQNMSVVNGPAKLLHPLLASQIDKATQDHIAAINEWYLPTINRGLAGEVGMATDDGTFWSVRSSLEKASSIEVPTFIVGSSHDIFQRDEPLLYEQLKTHVNTKLLIMPGVHLQTILGGMKDKNNAQFNGAPGSEALLLQWFDQYLKGMKTGVQQMPNVTQFVDGYGAAGAERYASTTDWPHPAMTPQRLYLRGDQTISAQAPTTPEASYTISEPPAPTVLPGTNKAGTMLQVGLTFPDGSDCSISHYQWSLGFSGLTGTKPCYADNTQVEAAQHAINYETAVLGSDLYLNGPIQADIWMSATNAQAAVSIRVDDFDPATGVSKPLTNGLQSAAFRAVDASRSRFVNGVMMQPWHPFTAASILPVVPGQPMLVPVEVFPTAAVIKVGHKLRISISASNQVQGIWSLDRQAQANGNVSTILIDPAHASSIVLPVVPTSVLN
ncbi:MAG: CocE/NonD family hydrolase [Pseudomonadota bacterium]